PVAPHLAKCLLAPQGNRAGRPRRQRRGPARCRGGGDPPLRDLPREGALGNWGIPAGPNGIITPMEGRLANPGIQLKTPGEVEGMRVAGRLASEVLDYITPYVKPGVTTGHLDQLCHDYMVKVQGTVPAPLNYAPPGHRPYPKSICTSVNHQVCHGVPGEKVLRHGDIVNIDI